MLLVIFIGNVRIRGEYLNSMFIAVAMDGNNNTTPIAFGIGVANNVNSCTWFLMRLKDAIGEGREVAFITDMDDTISSYVGQVFPDAYHGYSSKSVLIYCRLRIGHSKNLDYILKVIHYNIQKLRMKSSHFGVWHCEEEDCYVCSDNNPIPKGPNFPLPDNIPDDIFQAMKATEEANKRDSQISLESTNVQTS
uniref:MULE transposase domain-containing protein n=1 Tax=Lactuca sativa TaxID=4236 RepID=A0A9R1XU07_LACSA|nr:hypothetical protein LSAT_V11C100034400 [Lactuca sativa]